MSSNLLNVISAAIYAHCALFTDFKTPGGLINHYNLKEILLDQLGTQIISSDTRMRGLRAMEGPAPSQLDSDSVVSSEWSS